MEEVGTQQGLLCFLEEHAGVPSVRQMWGAAIPVAVLPRREGLAVGEAARFPADEVVHAHQPAHLAANDVGLGRRGQPLIQRAALVRLKVAEADVAQV